MGAATNTIEAGTITELRQKARAWVREAKDRGLSDIRLGWDRERVAKTEKGYSIVLWAHT